MSSMYLTAARQSSSMPSFCQNKFYNGIKRHILLFQNTVIIKCMQILKLRRSCLGGIVIDALWKFLCINHPFNNEIFFLMESH